MTNKQSAYAGLVVATIAIVVFQAWHSAVRPVLEAIAAQDDEKYADAMSANLFGFCIGTPIILAIFLSIVPGAIRLRKVRKSESAPDVLVLTARGNPELRRVLQEGNFFAGRHVKKTLPGVTFTLSANSTGVRFWVGMSNPEYIVELAWTEVDRVTTDSVQVGSRNLPSISMEMCATGSKKMTISFALSRDGILTAFPRGRGEVEAVALTLNELRASGVTTRHN